jgi:phosphatidylglycerophosphatase A
MIKLLGTFFYSGYFPIAPGTFSSILAIILGVLIFNIIGLYPFILCTFIVFFLGWWVSHKMILQTQNTDPSEVVIDELVGQWIGMLPLLFFLNDNFNKTEDFPIKELFATFILFRIFDIVKIGPIKWADNLKTGFGVMFDDVLAGILAGLIMTIYLFYFKELI